MRRAGPVIVLLAVAAAAAFSGTERGPAATGYLGPASCRPCHEQLHSVWEQSAHARTTQVATAENLPPEVVAGGSVSHPPAESTFRREGDRFFVTTVGADGKRSEYPVTHVIGPRRVSFFLTRMEDDRLQVLPAMREVPTGEWFDYTHLIFGVPGFPYDTPPTVRPGEPSFWTGPIRAYDRSCARCHTSGRKAVVPLADGSGTREEWHPLEVDCEACHGPGAEHVGFWRDPPSDPAAKDPVLVLGELGRERAQGLCLWCHMESEVVDPDYRPGDDVFEHLSPTLLDNLERIDAAGRPLELIYDGLVFEFSACAKESGLTCLSCHDAHGGPHRADLLVPADRTQTLCNGCHLDIAAEPRKHTFHDPAKSGGRCVSCHMPFLEIERGHGIVRDHTIGSPHPDLYGGRVAKDACTGCHTGAEGAPEDAPAIPMAEVKKAYRDWYPKARLRPGWVEAIAKGRAGLPDAVFPLIRTAGDERNPRLVRASATRLLGKYPGSALSYLVGLLDDEDSVVRRSAATALASLRHPDADLLLHQALSDPSAAVRGAAARAALSGWERARANPGLLAALIPALEEEARAVPLDDKRWFRLGAARQLAGDAAGALEAYERKLELDPYAAYVRQAVEKLRNELGKD